MDKEIEQVIRDYFNLPGLEFLIKYPQVNVEKYWNGEDGEGLMQALTGYRLIPPAKLQTGDRLFISEETNRAMANGLLPNSTDYGSLYT